ncbi:hypothetical protein SO802_015158 [Lithocarpus litseifolius]|uniref:Uncharacterized protein n=1 Tax=Lithocarpus litseifolius TaxID=425828 RepID=A0AAW2CTI0_9ROSI
MNPEPIGPIRFEVGESSVLADPRPLTHEAHESVMVASSKTGHDISVAQTEEMGRPVESTWEVDSSVSGGFHAEEPPMTPGQVDTVLTHSVPQTEAMGRPANSSMVVDCPFSEGFCSVKPPMTLGKGIDTPHQGNQLVVSADCGYTEGEAGNANLGLGSVDNPSPLGLDVSVESNSGAGLPKCDIIMSCPLPVQPLIKKDANNSTECYSSNGLDSGSGGAWKKVGSMSFRHSSLLQGESRSREPMNVDVKLNVSGGGGGPSAVISST